MKDAFLDVLRAETRLLIICQEGQTIFDKQFRTSCDDLNNAKLPDMIEIGLKGCKKDVKVLTQVQMRPIYLKLTPLE